MSYFDATAGRTRKLKELPKHETWFTDVETNTKFYVSGFSVEKKGIAIPISEIYRVMELPAPEQRVFRMTGRYVKEEEIYDFFFKIDEIVLREGMAMIFFEPIDNLEVLKTFGDQDKQKHASLS